MRGRCGAVRRDGTRCPHPRLPGVGACGIHIRRRPGGASSVGGSVNYKNQMVGLAVALAWNFATNLGESVFGNTTKLPDLANLDVVGSTGMPPPQGNSFNVAGFLLGWIWNVRAVAIRTVREVPHTSRAAMLLLSILYRDGTLFVQSLISVVLGSIDALNGADKMLLGMLEIMLAKGIPKPIVDEIEIESRNLMSAIAAEGPRNTISSMWAISLDVVRASLKITKAILLTLAPDIFGENFFSTEAWIGFATGLVIDHPFIFVGVLTGVSVVLFVNGAAHEFLGKAQKKAGKAYFALILNAIRITCRSMKVTLYLMLSVASTLHMAAKMVFAVARDHHLAQSSSPQSQDFVSPELSIPVSIPANEVAEGLNSNFSGNGRQPAGNINAEFAGTVCHELEVPVSAFFRPEGLGSPSQKPTAAISPRGNSGETNTFAVSPAAPGSRKPPVGPSSRKPKAAISPRGNSGATKMRGNSGAISTGDSSTDLTVANLPVARINPKATRNRQSIGSQESATSTSGNSGQPPDGRRKPKAATKMRGNSGAISTGNSSTDLTVANWSSARSNWEADP